MYFEYFDIFLQEYKAIFPIFWYPGNVTVIQFILSDILGKSFSRIVLITVLAYYSIALLEA